MIALYEVWQVKNEKGSRIEPSGNPIISIDLEDLSPLTATLWILLLINYETKGYLVVETLFGIAVIIYVE